MKISTPSTFQRWVSRLKFEHQFSIPLDMEKMEFLSLIDDNIDEDRGLQLFESISPRLKPYKGFINPNGFKVRRRRRAFESNSEMARITGTVKSDLRQTVLNVHIGFDELKLKVILGFILFTYVAVLALLLTTNVNDGISLLPLLMVGHGLLIFGILFFVLRYQIRLSTRKFRQFLEDLLANAGSTSNTGENNQEESLDISPEIRKTKLFRR